MNDLERELIGAEADLVAKANVIKQRLSKHREKKTYQDYFDKHIERVKQVETYSQRRAVFETEYNIIKQDILYEISDNV